MDAIAGRALNGNNDDDDDRSSWSLNPCSYIISPAYWINYNQYITDYTFSLMLNATQDYSGTSCSNAVNILNNNNDQYHRYLLATELNSVWNGVLQGNCGSGGPFGAGHLVWPANSFNQYQISSVSALSYGTPPESASSDLLAVRR